MKLMDGFFRAIFTVAALQWLNCLGPNRALSYIMNNRVKKLQTQLASSIHESFGLIRRCRFTHSKCWYGNRNALPPSCNMYTNLSFWPNLIREFSVRTNNLLINRVITTLPVPFFSCYLGGTLYLVLVVVEKLLSEFEFLEFPRVP